MLVKELQAESYNPILLYKPQGITDLKLSTISKDGFILALQTEFQRDIYRQYASTVICIDSTHKANAYDFKLVTLMVVDEYGEGNAPYIQKLSVLPRPLNLSMPLLLFLEANQITNSTHHAWEEPCYHEVLCMIIVRAS